MKKKLIVCLAMVLTVTFLNACESKKTNTETNDKAVNDSANYDEYYNWKDDIIVSLSEEGKKAETLVIPERCIEIGKGAFTFDTYTEPNKTVKKIVFLNPNTKLEDGFENFVQLKEIKLPENLKNIPSNCFADCTSLEMIEIPESLESISEYSFAECQSLKKIEIGKNVKTIEKSAFLGCENLEEVVFNSKLENIEADAFYNCSKLKEIKLEEGVKQIGMTAFTGCESLLNVYLPASIENIDGTALEQLSTQTTTVWVKKDSYADKAFEKEYGISGGLEKKYY